MPHAEIALRIVSALSGTATMAAFWRKYNRDRRADRRDEATRRWLEHAIQHRQQPSPDTMPAWAESCRR